MKRQLKILLASLMFVMMLSLSACSTSYSDASSKHIKNVTAITEVFGDGQKVSAAVVEYDKSIDTLKLKASDYSVKGKTITKVYSNTKAAKASKGVNGKYVIIELSTNYTNPDYANNGSGAGKEKNDKSTTNGTPQGKGSPQLGSAATDSSKSKLLIVSVVQKGDIVTTDGETYKGDTSVNTNSKDINLVVDDFKQFVYSDPNYNNKKLMYNLYVPKNYNPSKKYPLVLFMHDAGVVSNNPTNTLTQGLGAVIWATPSEQAKNECFVLAPQYTSIIADDTSKTTEQMDITVDLVKKLCKEYSIDTNRLYNTGQSMGGMTSIAMDIKYPDMFAASLLVACQWDATKVAPMAKKNLWIIVSEGDNKANPGMDAITKELKKQGAAVSKATWSAQSSSEEFTNNVNQMLSSGSNINYTVFKGGNHRYTWQYAYTIEGVRDWLFKQVKK